MNKPLAKIDIAQIPADQLEPTAEAVKDSPLLANLREITDFAACLEQLLIALNWRGSTRHAAEAMPHFADDLDLTGLRNVMANLKYSSRPERVSLHKIDARLMPCLFVPDNGAAMVVLGRTRREISVFDGGTASFKSQDRRMMKVRGTAYFFNVVDVEDMQAQVQKTGWFNTVAERFRPLVYQILAVTFFLNLLALATPLFVMAVYDRVVATGSLSTLAYFGIGVLIALVADIFLRRIRTRILAFVGARLDNIVGNAVFQRIMFLPPAFTERATIGAQVARIKDFESVRDFFTGPMAMVLFELPFTLIFIIVIFALGGPVGFVPLVMIAMFAVVGVIFSPLIRQSVTDSARHSSKRQEFLVEALSAMRAIKYTGSEKAWLERFRELSAKASMASFKTSQLTALINTISHVLMIAAGVATIAFGVFQVFAGNMTIGGLVASMILVWRVLAPLQTGFLTLTRIEQVKSSIKQINNLMSIKPEREPDKMVAPIRKIQGRVTFARVSLRYSADADPALVGVNFEATPGEVVALVGGNGSGKSTIVKLLLGMYTPQAGSIRIDNIDIRQMDPIELRHAIGYVPQSTQYFYGTISQNLRLANPAATDADIREACEMAMILDEIEQLPNGFYTRIGDGTSGQLPTSMQQGLNLARAYVKRAPIMLFDEPGNGLDFEADKAFMNTVSGLREKYGTTSFLVTHRPSHIRIADKIVWLEAGHLRMSGPAEEVKKHMPKDFL